MVNGNDNLVTIFTIETILGCLFISKINMDLKSIKLS